MIVNYLERPSATARNLLVSFWCTRLTEARQRDPMVPGEVLLCMHRVSEIRMLDPDAFIALDQDEYQLIGGVPA